MKLVRKRNKHRHYIVPARKRLHINFRRVFTPNPQGGNPLKTIAPLGAGVIDGFHSQYFSCRYYTLLAAIVIFLLSYPGNLFSQTSSKSFELRYITDDIKANGETDFKGSTEWMDTDQRIEFLKAYADYASFFFGDHQLNRKIVQEDEIEGVLHDLKPQPLTNYRKTVLLNEWKESQAWQAFSAWESMKKQVLLGYDGFSWCCLHGGANMGTYKKPLIDNLGHAKLAFYTNKMVFQDTWAASDNVDVVYGSGDYIIPVINHLGDIKKVDLVARLVSIEGKVLDKKVVTGISLGQGHTFTKLDGFRFKPVAEGIYVITYDVVDAK